MSVLKPLLFALSVAAASNAHAADTTPPEISRYLKKQGPVIEHRIFRSEASDQIVVRFCVDENRKGGANEGASNPANVHCEVALFNKKGKWVFANQVFIGQGSIREYSSGMVRGESVTYAPEDPLCCPSKKKPLVFSTAGGKLVPVPQ